MVGLEEWAAQHKGLSLPQHARHTVHSRDLHALLKGERGHDPRQAFCQHGFSGAGRSGHQHIVKTGSRNLHGLFCNGLSSHIGQIHLSPKLGLLLKQRIDIHLSRGNQLVPAARRRIHIHDQLVERAHSDHPDSLDHSPLFQIVSGQNTRADPLLPGHVHDREHSPDRPDLPIEPQFSGNQDVLEILLSEHAHADQFPDCHRQVDHDSPLRDIGWCQIHSDS